MGEVQVGRAVNLLVENGISIMTTGTAHSPVPPVERLHDAGVPVFSGSDGIREARSTTRRRTAGTVCSSARTHTHTSKKATPRGP